MVYVLWLLWSLTSWNTYRFRNVVFTETEMLFRWNFYHQLQLWQLPVQIDLCDSRVLIEGPIIRAPILEHGEMIMLTCTAVYTQEWLIHTLTACGGKLKVLPVWKTKNKTIAHLVSLMPWIQRHRYVAICLVAWLNDVIWASRHLKLPPTGLFS